MSWGTVDLLEVVWTLAALPGLLVWVVNLRSAYRSFRAVRLASIFDIRRTVAGYSVRKCWILIVVSGVFALIGIVAMLRPPNEPVPHWDWLRVLLTAGLLGAPVLITFLGFDWRHVEATVLQSALRGSGVRTTGEPTPRKDR